MFLLYNGIKVAAINSSLQAFFAEKFYYFTISRLAKLCNVKFYFNLHALILAPCDY